jgi:predicted transcriptional regulator
LAERLFSPQPFKNFLVVTLHRLTPQTRLKGSKIFLYSSCAYRSVMPAK